MSLLRWTRKSTRTIAQELNRLGHSIQADTVRRLLEDMDYPLQVNQKVKEGPQHPDRDGQFRYRCGRAPLSGKTVLCIGHRTQQLYLVRRWQRLGVRKHNWQRLPNYASRHTLTGHLMLQGAASLCFKQHTTSRKRPEILDSIQEPAFYLFRRFVLVHRIGFIIHLYRPGSTGSREESKVRRPDS